jgi:hypothetical protein
MAQKTLLELTTEAPERACIRIDDNLYQLRSREDLGLKEDAEFSGMMTDFEVASNAKDWRQMAAVLDRMVQGVVIDMPAEVLAKLNDTKKLKIVQAFTTEVGSRLPSLPREAVAA